MFFFFLSYLTLCCIHNQLIVTQSRCYNGHLSGSYGISSSFVLKYWIRKPLQTQEPFAFSQATVTFHSLKEELGLGK